MAIQIKGYKSYLFIFKFCYFLSSEVAAEWCFLSVIGLSLHYSCYKRKERDRPVFRERKQERGLPGLFFLFLELSLVFHAWLLPTLADVGPEVCSVRSG